MGKFPKRSALFVGFALLEIKFSAVAKGGPRLSPRANDGHCNFKICPGEGDAKLFHATASFKKYIERIGIAEFAVFKGCFFFVFRFTYEIFVRVLFLSVLWGFCIFYIFYSFWVMLWFSRKYEQLRFWLYVCTPFWFLPNLCSEFFSD